MYYGNRTREESAGGKKKEDEYPGRLSSSNEYHSRPERTWRPTGSLGQPDAWHPKPLDPGDGIFADRRDDVEGRGKRR